MESPPQIIKKERERENRNSKHTTLSVQLNLFFFFFLFNEKICIFMKYRHVLISRFSRNHKIEKPSNFYFSSQKPEIDLLQRLAWIAVHVFVEKTER